MKEKVPRSLNQIAQRLGYQSASSFRSRFPDLCKAITARRREWLAKQRNTLRTGLEAILRENPPPSPNQAAIQLGDKHVQELKKYYPQLTHAISRRHAVYQRAQFKNLPKKLKEILYEEPSSSLGAVASRLGHTPEYLKKHFPELSSAITKRHAQLSRKRSLEKTKDAKQRVRQFALDLHAAGVYPSAHRLRKEMNGPTLGTFRAKLHPTRLKA
ncbi:MAG TPA: hypothetical protein VK582_07230 [Pyrinomonadaceae bacterium]|nr:hypothetical protein [Pyrinomonadaceae bacterium]